MLINKKFKKKPQDLPFVVIITPNTKYTGCMTFIALKGR